MADYFGPEQNRVLEVKNRNIDNVVFQYKKPPLSSEWNLINQISNEKIQNLTKFSIPSGWLYVEDIFENISEDDVPTSGVLCSTSYPSNSFKLISKGNNFAVVNGWLLLVQGTNSGDINNVITLNNPTGQFYDFVFLEVWRKLIGPEDPIYPYGNVLTNPYLDNEIKWDVIGCETTKRIQLQYRIRSIRIVSSIIDCTKEIFDMVDIHPIGGRNSGEAALSKFNKYGSIDSGLYIAGDGTDNSKEYLSTVDGFVYAIPMFLVYRRKLADEVFSSTQLHNNYTDKEKFLNGYRSDRVDNKLVDVIYKDDIIDLRHKVGNFDLTELADKTIAKLISGELSTTVKKGFDNNGTFTNACSGGRELVKVERINSVSGDNIPDIGNGSSISSSSFKRRAFCNSELICDHNIIEITNTGSWTEGSFLITSRINLPAGEIVSVDGFYSPDQGLVTGVSSDGVSIFISNSGSAPIVGTTNRLFMEFTFKYYSSSIGFKDVPREFLEVNKNDSTIIATRDKKIPLRFNNNDELLNFGASSGEIGYPGDITQDDYFEYKGVSYTDLLNSGHLLVLHRKTNSYGKVNIDLIDSKYNQHYILGVKGVEVNGTFVSFTSERIVTTVPFYKINSYIITVPSYLNEDVKIYLYTGSKFLNVIGESYSLENSIKFFELSKQGKGITDTFELIETIAIENPIGSGDYYIDTNDKPIIKLATISVKVGSYVESIPFAYKYNSSDTHVLLSDNISTNRKYPILKESEYENDYLPTKIKIKGPSGLEKLRVPIFVHSYVSLSEGFYNFFYKTIPYQGLLNTTSSNIYGKISRQSKAIITTLGSGSIKNYSYKEGLISIVNGSRNVTGTNTLFTKYVKKGDYLKVYNNYKHYRIEEVVTDTSLILTESYNEMTKFDTSYEIIRLDIPITNISNLVERLPSYSMDSIDRITDYTCYSDDIDDYKGLLITIPKEILQDPLEATVNSFILGNGQVNRGNKNLEFNDIFYKLNQKKPYLIYENITNLPTGHKKRICQFYLFIRTGKEYFEDGNLTGKVYLLALTSESEDNSIHPNFDNVVDIYEIINRPIIRG